MAGGSQDSSEAWGWAVRWAGVQMRGRGLGSKGTAAEQRAVGQGMAQVDELVKRPMETASGDRVWGTWLGRGQPEATQGGAGGCGHCLQEERVRRAGALRVGRRWRVAGAGSGRAGGHGDREVDTVGVAAGCWRGPGGAGRQESQQSCQGGRYASSPMSLLPSLGVKSPPAVKTTFPSLPWLGAVM